MKKRKTNERGITLISLVITIILLLILATVAINLAVDSDGLFGKAGEAKNLWNNRVTEEETILGGLEDILEKYARIGVEVAPGIYQDENDAKRCYIYEAEGLNNLNQMFINYNMPYQYIEIMTDIDYAGTDYVWVSVDCHADTRAWFREINGNGHTLKNIPIEGKAMFWRLSSQYDITVKDIIFDNVTVSSNTLDSAVICGQTYNNTLLENVVVKNSFVTGAYRVGSMIGSVDHEDLSAITLTIKNCTVQNTTIKATAYDFCTCGMVAFVNASDNDKVVFEGENFIENVVLDISEVKDNVYEAHAFIYTEGSSVLINSADGVTVSNVIVKTEL